MEAIDREAQDDRGADHSMTEVPEGRIEREREAIEEHGYEQRRDDREQAKAEQHRDHDSHLEDDERKLDGDVLLREIHQEKEKAANDQRGSPPA